MSAGVVAGLATYHHEGPPGAARVVLVHGSMDRAAAFLKVTRRLPELDVVRYDRRGYGRSVDGGIARGIDEMVDDLLAVVGDQPAVVIGHSLGGVIALTAAQRHPERVPSVGAFESPLAWRDWWPTASAGGQAMQVAGAGVEGDGEAAADAAERFMRRMVGDERWERLPPRTRRERRREGPALLADLSSIRGEAPYEPALVEVPVLAGYGTESRSYHQEAARVLAAEAPQGELMVVEGSGHACQSSHPAEFVAFVRRAVERAPSSSSSS